MNIFLLLISVAVFTISFSVHSAEFPTTPDAYLTPGSLCDKPDKYRYPEKIPYCDRDSMDRNVKDEVFRNYRNRGYHLDLRRRDHYKIDHLIPLCAGGSNRGNNLWPQHMSIFKITDPLETLGCEILADGKISQADLVELILSAKRNLSTVPRALNYLNRLN